MPRPPEFARDPYALRAPCYRAAWTFTLLALGAAACSQPADSAPGGQMAGASSAGTAAGGTGAAPVSSAPVTSMVTNEDGSTVTTQADGTITVTNPDGTVTTTTADGTVIMTGVDGMVTTADPDGSVTAGDTAGSSTGGGATSGDGTTSGDPSGSSAVDPASVYINANGRVSASSNDLGIGGDWYAFGDGTTTTQSGNPYRDGKYCVSGEADGDSAHWGAGIGFDLNNVGGEKLPYEFTDQITGFRIKITGEAPAPVRLHFVADLDVDVNPFIDVTLGESVVYSIFDAEVPLTWGVDNAGMRVDAGVIYAVQLLAPGDSAAGPIDVCIEEFEPIFDPEAGAVVAEGDAFVNSDGFVFAESNGFGVQGPVYAIGDGNSTTQSGNPWQSGKYCVAGEFSGAAENWGAGIAFDLNKAPGASERLPFTHEGNVAAFRIGLSGTTPGGVRVQYVTNDPQEGNQPFLVGQMNSTSVYPIAWAQVPSSWEVSDAGLVVGASFYTVQVYLEGDRPGPFEVCVEDFEPLAAADVSYEAQAPSAGFVGFRTLDPEVLQGEYEKWKRDRLQDCGDGTACVPRDEGDCISEGVAYGMILAAGFDDQATFDKLWAYFEKHKNQNGVMTWQTNACGAAIASGSATDGELDAAMALIQADCKWGGNYEALALELIGAIKNSEVTTCNGRTVLKPGDSFGGCDETNPSYVAPAYYRVFEQLTGDTTWGNLVNDGYTLLATLQGRMDGLVPDWCDADGNPQMGDRGAYGPDASRTAWRIATDYVWNDEPRAATFLDNLAAHIDANGGIPRLFTPNSNYRGALAMSALSDSSAKAQEYTDAWLMTSVDDGTYFPGTLRPIYMLLLAQLFAKGC